MTRRLLQIDAVLAAATFAVHLALSNRYDFFRDELYFIDCGRRPAFGYVDQPPLVPLLSALTQAGGHDLILLRAIPALAAAGAVFTTCALARLLGGGAFAQGLAGLGVAAAPMMLGLTSTFNTSVFEPLAWTLVALLAARVMVLDDRRALLWMGLVAGLALEAKYEIEFYLIPLTVAIALLPQRRMLAYRETLLGALIAVLIAAPSIIWQAVNGWPFAELVAAAPDKNVAAAPAGWFGGQVIDWNPWFALVWAGGLGATLFDQRLAQVRALGIAFLLTVALVLAAHGKDYYVAGAFPPMLAAGAVWWEWLVQTVWLRALYVALAVSFSVVAAPTSLPLLDPPAVASYMQALHLAPRTSEKSLAGSTLPQHFADQLGWRDLERAVAAAFVALPANERAHAAIITSNYGQAGAINFYGPADHLPRALSGHNQYYLWGDAPYDGSIILRVGGNFDRYRKLCREASIVGHVGLSPFVVPNERNRSIILCRGLHKPLDKAWPDFKHFD